MAVVGWDVSMGHIACLKIRLASVVHDSDALDGDDVSTDLTSTRTKG